METQPIFNDTIGVMAVITMIPVFFLWLERTTRWKIFSYLPAIIWIFLTPVFLSYFGVIPRESPIYTNFKALAVPMFIVLMLLDINIRQAVKVAWRGAGVLVMGSLGIVAGAVMAFYLFRSGLPKDTALGFGALAGSWIGGTGNLAAVAEGLQTPSSFSPASAGPAGSIASPGSPRPRCRRSPTASTRWNARPTRCTSGTSSPSSGSDSPASCWPRCWPD